MSPVRAIYRYALRNPSSGVAVNPTVGLELPSTKGPRERIAPPDECAKLLSALRADRALWATAMYAGLRRGELQSLRVECESPIRRARSAARARICAGHVARERDLRSVR
jgi:integrase